MAVSEAQKRAVEKYKKEHYARVLVLMPKGRKEAIKEHSEKLNESMNLFINIAIENRVNQIESASGNGEQEKPPKNIV